MNIRKFIDYCPYLYHLTDSRNLPHIFEFRKILSTKTIIEAAKYPNGDEFLRQKRPNHSVVNVTNKEIHIRDQRPIIMNVLNRSVSNGMTGGAFIYHLNKRVFFWPNANRLNRHYKRYVHERPVILRFSTEDILELYPDAEFSSINSGATRCHPYYGGNAPTRGLETFLIAHDYNDSVKSVAEVTILDFCKLPDNFELGNSPYGTWKKVKLN